MVNTGIRLLGAVLVVVSCSGMGFFLAGQWGERLKTMEHLRKMIFLLKGEIVYARSALPESFERTGKKGGGEIGDLFVRVAGRMEGQRGEPFYDIWQEEIEKLPKAFCLSKEDRQSLKGLGEHLGYLDLEMQERTILLYLEQLDLTIGNLREHKQERSRLPPPPPPPPPLFITSMMY